MDEKSNENILNYDIPYKTSIVPKPLRIGFNKIDGFIRIYDGTRYFLVLKIMMLFTTELDILQI